MTAKHSPAKFSMPMTAQDYQEALENLGLPARNRHVLAGQMLGVSERTSWRYAQGESAIPGSVERLLAMLLRDRGFGVDYRTILVHSTITSQQGRNWK